jgi:predicted Zn-dependent protease
MGSFFQKSRRSSHGFRQRPSIGSWLATPFRFVAGLFGAGDRGIGEQLPWHLLIFRGALKVLAFPIAALFHVGQFVVVSWSMSRSLPLLIPGLLPAAIGAGLVGVVFMWPFVEERAVSGRYNFFRGEREKAGEHRLALLGSKRVADVSKTSNAKYVHAVTLHNAGMTQQSRLLMEELAVFRKDGFPEAHLFLGQLHFQNFEKSQYQDTAAAEAAAKYLDYYADLMPNVDYSTITGYLLRARLWQKTGKEPKAMEFFETVTGIDPSVVPDLVKYLRANNRPEDAQLAIRRGVERLVEIAERMPENPAIWETMYQILVAGDKYQQAIEEFNRAFQASKAPAVRSQLRELQSRAMMEYYDKLPPSDVFDDQKQKILILSDAITAFPRNMEALSAFADMALYNTNPEVNEWLSRLVIDKTFPSYLSHLREGARLAIEGKPEQSRKHFELAVLSDGMPAVVLTDLARLLATEKGKTDDGLKILDVATSVWDSPILNASRGSILLATGKPEEALIELEYAVSELPRDPEIWRLLADCREALGNKDGAAVAREKEAEARRALRELMMNAQQQGAQPPVN